ncbi:MAG TPA: hypothetical protein PKZ42_01785 [Syntrophales bacterium]|nr:hypothetical protein [Syntrophales bacterium]
MTKKILIYSALLALPFMALISFGISQIPKEQTQIITQNSVSDFKVGNITPFPVGAPSYWQDNGDYLTVRSGDGILITASSTLTNLHATIAGYLTESDYYGSSTPEHITSLPNSSYITLTDLSATSPLTYNSGTGVIAVDGSYNIPLTGSTTEWTTAYGWGDHSTAGYLTSVSLSDLTLDTGNIYIGDASNNPTATSSLFMDTNGYVGVASSSPSWTFSVGSGPGTATTTSGAFSLGNGFCIYEDTSTTTPNMTIGACP